MSPDVRRYRVEIEVPRVVPRPGLMTTWRTLAVRDSYSDVGDLSTYLIDSMELAGIDRDQARGWVQSNLRCTPEVTSTTRQPPEVMPIDL